LENFSKIAQFEATGAGEAQSKGVGRKRPQLTAARPASSETVFPGLQPRSKSILEFIRRDACHFERAPQSAEGNLPVHGDDATTLALRRDFLEDDMAAALAIHEKSESS
jgi:hypothetical protein